MYYYFPSPGYEETMYDLNKDIYYLKIIAELINVYSSI